MLKTVKPAFLICLAGLLLFSACFNIGGDDKSDSQESGYLDVPVISGIAAGSFNTTQTFTITGISEASIVYTLDGGLNWKIYTAPVVLENTGTYLISARQIKESRVSLNTETYEVIIDVTLPDPPVVSGITNGFYQVNQAFSISGESGASIEYTINGGTDWLPYSATVNLAEEGSYTVMARQTDAVENLSANSTPIAVVIDRTSPHAPVITGVTSDGVYTTSVTISIQGEENADIRYSIDGGSTWFLYDKPVTFKYTGQYTVLARQTDRTGNQCESNSSVSFTINEADPVVIEPGTMSGDTTSCSFSHGICPALSYPTSGPDTLYLINLPAGMSLKVLTVS